MIPDWATNHSAPRAKPGIVHLGIGAFFRAFGLPMLEDAMQRAGGDWGVIGVSMRSAAVRDTLAEQDFMYHLLEKRADGDRARLITALRDVLVLPDEPQTVIDAVAEPDCHLVTLTITEKGYCHSSSSGGLNAAHPDIVHDLAHADRPRTAVGVLVRALAKRSTAGGSGLTIMSCDNLPGNGAVLRRVVLDFAMRVDRDLAEWIDDAVAFPSTMVDRIVPKPGPSDIAALAQITGLEDRAVIAHEPYLQWVIEDKTRAPFPALGEAGAQIVASVEAYEKLKLRCLNGTHSAIAYIGALLDIETVWQAVSAPSIRTFVEQLWHHEILPSLDGPEGVDCSAYVRDLLARYDNPAIVHRCQQIAMDGSQKLPQRILATIADNLGAGLPVNGLVVAVAAWMHYLKGETQSGQTYAVSDPLAETLQPLARSDDPVGELLAQREVFSADLAGSETFTSLLRGAYDDIERTGMMGTIEECVS